MTIEEPLIAELRRPGADLDRISTYWWSVKKYAENQLFAVMKVAGAVDPHVENVMVNVKRIGNEQKANLEIAIRNGQVKGEIQGNFGLQSVDMMIVSFSLMVRNGAEPSKLVPFISSDLSLLGTENSKASNASVETLGQPSLSAGRRTQ